jgi:hypothetical protein
MLKSKISEFMTLFEGNRLSKGTSANQEVVSFNVAPISHCCYANDEPALLHPQLCNKNNMSVAQLGVQASIEFLQTINMVASLLPVHNRIPPGYSHTKPAESTGNRKKHKTALYTTSSSRAISSSRRYCECSQCSV